jgi:cytoskeletal protein CcmA (bactofilin family)
MTCPTEFTLAQYADRELPGSEALKVTTHLQDCKECRELVEALQAENQALLQSLQYVESWETEPLRLKTTELVTLGVFAAFFSVTLVLLRTGLGVFLGIDVPPQLDWLYPFSLTGQLNWLANGLFYFILEGGPMVASVANTLGLTIMVLLVLSALVAGARRLKGVTALIGVVFMTGIFVVPGNAMEIRRAEKGRSISIPAGETVDDTLVAFADSINVRGTITGDLVAFARQIAIQGTVQGDVIVFAQRIEITGNVGGDVFGFGQTVQANGLLGRNLWGFGQTVSIGSAGKLENNATLFGAEANVDGQVGSDLTAYAGFLDIGSKIGRDVQFRGDRLLIRAPSTIGRNLNVTTKSEQDTQIESGVSIQGKKTVDFFKPKPSKYRRLGFYVRESLWIGAAFFMGLLLYWFFPQVGRIPLSNGRFALKSGGVGFLAAVAAPVAALLLGITVIGLPIALVTLVLWLLGLYLSKIIVARFIGGAILKTGDARMSSIAPSLVVGLIIVIICVDLPYVGGVINFLLVLIGLGALVITAYQQLGSKKSEVSS